MMTCVSVPDCNSRYVYGPLQKKILIVSMQRKGWCSAPNRICSNCYARIAYAAAVSRLPGFHISGRRRQSASLERRGGLLCAPPPDCYHMCDVHLHLP